MKHPTTPLLRLLSRRSRWLTAGLFLLLLCPAQAHASLFKGEAPDTLADVLTWVVLIVAPVVGIAVFWIVHILPAKIAEKKQHPQAKAVQCLCPLSLLRVKSEQLAQRVNLHLALGGSFTTNAPAAAQLSVNQSQPHQTP
jgi:hypothetical protein